MSINNENHLNDILDAMADARSPRKHASAASVMLGKPLTVEEGRSFLVYLVSNTLSNPVDADIVLSSWGLLRDMEGIESKIKRREELIRLLGLNYGPTNLNHKENDLYKILADKCMMFHTYPESVDGYLAKAISEAQKRDGELPFLSSITKNDEADNEQNHHRLKPPYPGPESFRRGIKDVYIERHEVEIVEHPGICIISGLEGAGKLTLLRNFIKNTHFPTSINVYINASSPKRLHYDCVSFLSHYIIASGRPRTETEVRNAFVNFFNTFDGWIIVFHDANYSDNDPEANQKWENLWSYFPTLQRGITLVTTTSERQNIMGIKPKYLPPFNREQAIQYLRNFYRIDGLENVLLDKVGLLPKDLLEAAEILRVLDICNFRAKNTDDFVKAFEEGKEWISYFG